MFKEKLGKLKLEESDVKKEWGEMERRMRKLLRKQS